jgi:hypothetical protein
MKNKCRLTFLRIVPTLEPQLVYESEKLLARSFKLVAVKNINRNPRTNEGTE